MTILTDKQHTKIRAALALIHDSGGDALAVGQAAQRSIASGMAPKKAYEQALTAHVDANPAISNQILHTLKLIEASDGPTVTTYGAALTRYNDTGDRTALDGLAETFAKDSIALAVKNGELSATDTGNRAAVEAALGFGFDDALIERATPYDATPAAAATPQPVTPSPAPQAATPAPPSRTAFSGKDGASPSPGTYSSGFQGDKRAAMSQATMRQPVAMGGGGPASFKPIARDPVAPGPWPDHCEGGTLLAIHTAEPLG
ncbi:MAG TPA: hypothetical protein VF463_07760 [Sphingobium sp.]